jgi:hypothetical protein
VKPQADCLSFFQKQSIFDFIAGKLPLQLEDVQYDVTSNFPRKIFTDPNVTLKEANLVPSAMLILSPKS